MYMHPLPGYEKWNFSGAYDICIATDVAFHSSFIRDLEGKTAY